MKPLAPATLLAMVVACVGDSGAVVRPAGSPPIEAGDLPSAAGELAPALDAAVAAASADEWNLERVRSGTRLRAIFALTADGQRYFQSEWYDASLGVRCRFALAADGKSRCLPLPPRAAIQQGLVRYYRDQGCAEPLLPAQGRDAACGAAYGVRTSETGIAIHRLATAQRVERAYALVPNAEGALECRATEVVGGKDFFTPGPNVPPDSFVASMRHGPESIVGRRIWPVVRATADGMRARTGWWDSRLMQECTVRRGPDGSHRCLPRVVLAPAPIFADAACKRPAVVAHAVGTGTPVRVAEADRCPARETLYRTELQAQANLHYRLIDQRCESAPLPAGAQLYAVGAPLGLDEFVPWAEARTGTGRLQARELRSAEGAVERAAEPFDSTFGDTCVFARGDANRLLCLPATQESSDGLERFADAGCQVRAMAQTPVLACARSAQASLLEGPWCAPVVRTRAVVGISRQVYLLDAAGKCTPGRAGDYRTLGNEVAPASFADATDVTL